MMMSTLKIDRRFTPAEYYEMERQAVEKHDYYQGEIYEVYAMAGGTSTQSRIKTDLIGILCASLKGQPCQPYDSDQRIRVPATGLRTYPDASVFCGELEYDPDDEQRETATNPSVLFEVLSPSTEGYDRGLKAEHFRQIPSLQAYVLIAQDHPQVEVYARSEGSATWVLTEAKGCEASARIGAIGVSIPLGELYRRVKFSTE